MQNSQNKFFQTQKNILPKFPTPILPRKDWNKFTRLRIGHCLFSHRHNIEKKIPPLCGCGQNMNIFHIFIECRLFHQHRIKNKINAIAILESEYDFVKVKGFLNEIRFVTNYN